MRTIESRIVQEAIRRNQQALDDLYDSLPRRSRLTVIDGGRPDAAPPPARSGRAHWAVVPRPR